MNCTCCEEYGLVCDLLFSQAGATKTHKSVLEISRNVGIPQLSVGHVIHDTFRAIHLQENNSPIQLLFLMYSRVL